MLFMDKKTKIRTTFYLGPAEHAALEKLSKETDVPVAAMIRRAIAEWLKKQKGGER